MRLPESISSDAFRSRVLAILAVVMLCGSVHPALAGRQTIHLKNGMLLRAEVLREKPDVVLVDLGFTVLSIPTAEIEQITGEDLYRVAANREEMSVEQNVERCSAAVVEVRTSIGLGSGFIINPEGYVVTNDHVIAGEYKITITVFQQKGRDLEKVQLSDVRVVATNPYVDLALLKIDDLEGRELSYLPLGDSDRLFQGQSVFAIGSPLGLERSVSEGIVSVRNRPIGGRLFVQSTVQVNSGNSGGPLIDLRGEVVGVNNMKIAAVGVEGMSFAVPVGAVKDFLRNRDSFAFDQRNPNSGFRYLEPPTNP
jgi:serine protease Do